MSKEIINTSNAPAPIGPYNQSVKANGFLFVSGQIAIIPETNELEMRGVKEETRQVMENIKAILTEAGLGFEHVVKCSIFLNDMGLFTYVNEVYGSYFTEGGAPARETVAVQTLPKNVNVEISVIAAY
ncbi:Rid family detoxifying hydrolase [Haoranjiania flava]|uniref:Rid family detoxifying hydrolase n=1 Tax=Haoranjiania flava TaxID=1856322 RepID=A0AAE3IKJ8_9BACT|nr:Rid family detoxifying hydrolase [Haoranjiania flava]MCU7693489.1 Rid family detoxifying hydrolase [Haoranjiania flava]